eukprot:scaffold101634_cov28-Tisochrysis_lutea.AAC.2
MVVRSIAARTIEGEVLGVAEPQALKSMKLSGSGTYLGEAEARVLQGDSGSSAEWASQTCARRFVAESEADLRVPARFALAGKPWVRNESRARRGYDAVHRRAFRPLRSAPLRHPRRARRPDEMSSAS